MPASAAKPARIEPDVPFRLVKHLPYEPSVPVSEIRRIVKKVVSERRAAEKASQADAAR